MKGCLAHRTSRDLDAVKALLMSGDGGPLRRGKETSSCSGERPRWAEHRQGPRRKRETNDSKIPTLMSETACKRPGGWLLPQLQTPPCSETESECCQDGKKLEPSYTAGEAVACCSHCKKTVWKTAPQKAKPLVPGGPSSSTPGCTQKK